MVIQKRQNRASLRPHLYLTYTGSIGIVRRRASPAAALSLLLLLSPVAPLRLGELSDSSRRGAVKSYIIL